MTHVCANADTSEHIYSRWFGPGSSWRTQGLQWEVRSAKVTPSPSVHVLSRYQVTTTTTSEQNIQTEA